MIAAVVACAALGNRVPGRLAKAMVISTGLILASAGRGVGVVANEVKQLAGQTAEATSQVEAAASRVRTD